MTYSLADAVAAEVRAEMARQRKTQIDLAAVLGLTRATVARRVSGKQPFEINELAALSEYFNVPIMTLLNGRAA